MNKRSKALMIGAAVGAVSLFAVTALASTPNTAGYDAFKAVLKANHMAEHPTESGALTGRFAIALDGAEVLAANGTAKLRDAGGAHAMSGDFDVTLMGIERSGSVYSGGDDSIYFVDRTHDLHYQLVNLDHDRVEGHDREREYERGAQPMSKAEEALLDYMVGDLKNEFGVTNHADGGKTITVDVSRDEIPLPLRLLLDVASNEERHERGAWDADDAQAHELLERLPFFQGLEEGVKLAEELPELTDDIAIERVRLALTVDRDNALQRVEGELEVTGKDEAGESHRVAVGGEGVVTDLDATTPDAYDPTGKSVEIIDVASFDERD